MATDRSKAFMNKVWDLRNSEADTEEKLVSAIVRLVAENSVTYVAQENLLVLDKNDILQLAQELVE